MWRERIIAATGLAGEFTLEDERDAGSWTTCAVGEQHQGLPEVVLYHGEKDWLAGPMDVRLQKLGTYFANAVMQGDANWAEVLLDEIEDRVLALKRGAHV